MKKILFFFALVGIISSCGDSNTNEEEVVKLESFKDKLSYSFGVEQVKQMTNDPNFKSMDQKMLLEGFNLGLNSKETQIDPACKEVLQKMFGPYGQDFEVAYVKEGSKCIGKVIGFEFIKFVKSIGGESKIDVKMVEVGFKHALQKKDSLVSEKIRMELINNFVTELNRASSTKMLDEANKIPNAKKLSNGIVIETIQEGNGVSPTPADDVEADYILTNAKGDTLESSFKIKQMQGSKEAPKFNLSGVIEGWRLAFPNLKKGGKYRLYIPANLAYGDQKGALCFYIEFINFGKAGTLVKPQPPQMGM